MGPCLVWAFEFGDDPSEGSLPGDVGLRGIGEDCNQQGRDTMAAGVSDQAAQRASKRNWSICREPVSEFGVPARLRLIGAVSGDGRVARRHGH